MARLLVVEDDRMTNESVCAYLQSIGHTVMPAYDGKEALSLFESDVIDLTILDIMLPKINGIAVLKGIRSQSKAPVLMLTAIGDEDTQIASFDGLADDYITKPFSLVLLGKRVAALLRRTGKERTITVWKHGDIAIDFVSYTAKNSDGMIDLKPKEFQLLKILIENKELVLSREQILDDVWGLDWPESDRTVDIYIRRIRQKLDLDCIRTIKGLGYKFVEEYEKD